MPGAAGFVWTVWAAMLLLALVYVGKFSSRVPFFDDWTLVPVLTGAEPLTPAYLWAPFNEHRVPLPKLVLYALGRLSGFDFRAGMVLNVLLLGGLSFAMLRTVGRMRGCLHFADAFFPLVVLSLAQWECFLIEYALNLVGSTVCAGAFLVLLAGADPHVLPRQAVRMAVCLVLLPLFGASGLVLVPALAVWLAFVGVLHGRAADAAVRRQGRLVLGLVAGALLLSGLYFVGLPPPSPGPRSPTAADTLMRGLQVLGMLFGAAALPGAPLKTVVVPMVLLAGGGVWLAAWRRQPHERVVLLGWLAFLLAMGCLVAAVAHGRSDYLGQTPFVPRYATLLLPLGCCVYFLWARYGGVSTAGASRMALMLLAAVMFAPNLQAAFESGRFRRRALRNFEADLACRLPPAFMAERGAGRVFPADQQEDVAGYIRNLRDSHTAAFRCLPEDLPVGVVAVPASAFSLRDMIFSGGVARPVGGDPALTIALPRARFVCAIRLHYAYTNSAGTADYFELSWQNDARAPSEAGRSRILLEAHPGAGERTITVWVNERIDCLRMVPTIKMFALKLRAVELLVPESAGGLLDHDGDDH
ncbi:MAG: hypothetical protein JWO38_337 [Gemmataceae bacterium]|nr:hypothetical protein [Gemmataceae bacterium]